MSHEIPLRHALFITELSRVLPGSALAEAVNRARTASHAFVRTSGEMLAPPKLSEDQLAICAWLLADEFSKAADEQLKAELAAANQSLKDERYGRHEQRQQYVTMCERAGAVRGSVAELRSAADALLEHLKQVPFEKERRW